MGHTDCKSARAVPVRVLLFKGNYLITNMLTKEIRKDIQQVLNKIQQMPTCVEQHPTKERKEKKRKG